MDLKYVLELKLSKFFQIINIEHQKMLKSTIFLMFFTGKLLKRQPKICRFFFENRYKFGANCPRMDLKDVID